MGMLESNINDAVSRPSAIRACAWDARARRRKRDPVDALRAAVASAAKNAQPSLASIRKKAETLGRDLPKQRRRLFAAARESAAAAAVSSSPKALPMPRVGFKGDDEDDEDEDEDDELDLDLSLIHI